jgi:hypothetical protein
MKVRVGKSSMKVRVGKSSMKVLGLEKKKSQYEEKKG